jgi:hypothetical protein
MILHSLIGILVLFARGLKRKNATEILGRRGHPLISIFQAFNACIHDATHFMLTLSHDPA